MRREGTLMSRRRAEQTADEGLQLSALKGEVCDAASHPPPGRGLGFAAVIKQLCGPGPTGVGENHVLLKAPQSQGPLMLQPSASLLDVETDE